MAKILLTKPWWRLGTAFGGWVSFHLPRLATFSGSRIWRSVRSAKLGFALLPEGYWTHRFEGLRPTYQGRTLRTLRGATVWRSLCTTLPLVTKRLQSQGYNVHANGL